jgi:hypothetical protein
VKCEAPAASRTLMSNWLKRGSKEEKGEEGPKKGKS